MEYPFPRISQHMEITTSQDKKIRIFSWNTYMGGSMPELCSYIQYVDGNSVRFTHLPDLYADLYDPGYYYDMVWSFTDAGKTYYLLTGRSQIANFTPAFVLRTLSITDNKIKNEHIFKTDNGLVNYLLVSYMANHYDYDRSMYIGDGNFPRIIFDAVQKNVIMPEVVYSEEWQSARLMGGVITFKWDNSHFLRK